MRLHREHNIIYGQQTTVDNREVLKQKLHCHPNCVCIPNAHYTSKLQIIRIHIQGD